MRGALGILALCAAPVLAGARQAADFTLPDLESKPVSLAEFKGRVVLLTFWASWCDDCKAEVPALQALQAKYRDRGFTVLGVSLDRRGAKDAAPFVRENRLSYPVLLSGGRAPKGYRVFGLPTSYLIGRDGAVIREFRGPIDAETVSRDIGPLLGP